MKRFARMATVLLLLAAGTRAFGGDDGATASGASGAGGTGGATDGGTFYSPLPAKVQEDLGDIRPAEAAGIGSYFHTQATVNGQYVSNAALYHSRDDADFLIAPMLQAGFAAPLNKQFDMDLEARLEDYTYSSNQPLGFWGVSGDAYLEWRYKPSWPRVYAGMEPYYYLSYANGNRLTSAIGPVAGVDQTMSLNRGKTLLYGGFHFGQYYSSPGIDTRSSETVTVSLTQQLERDYYAQLYWQLQYSDYTVYGRDETRDVIGLSVIHQFNPHTFASLFVNYVDNASNNSLAKYTTVNAGFAVVVQY
jgi:hypothetical protein